MDLEKLKEDWATDPGLTGLSFRTPEELQAHLLEAHRYLMDPARSGPLGYLYRKQVERNRTLTGRTPHDRHRS